MVISMSGEKAFHKIACFIIYIIYALERLHEEEKYYIMVESIVGVFIFMKNEKNKKFQIPKYEKLKIRDGLLYVTSAARGVSEKNKLMAP